MNDLSLKNNLNSELKAELQNLINSAVQASFGKANSIIKPEILRPKQVQQLLNCSRSHLDHLSDTDPTFPKKISLGNRWTGYRYKDLMVWIKVKSEGVI